MSGRADVRQPIDVPDRTVEGDWLPRLLYLGDVPIESYMHGSTLLYRLFQTYPRDKLMIVEGLSESDPARRIPNMQYSYLCPPAWFRLLRTRFASYVSPFAALRAPICASRVPKLVEDFRPEAVLSVVFGYSWVAAARYAERAGLPLHLIIHDEDAKLALRQSFEGRLIDRRLRQWYPKAVSRLCVSPYMADEYCRRYGEAGDVLYPSRSADALVYEAPPDRLSGPCDPFTLVFAGTIYHDYARAIQRAARALQRVGGRILVYGVKPNDGVDCILKELNIELKGRVSPEELIRSCHEEGHAIFVPMSYSEKDRQNMEVSFPSKLADCTATGLPILIDGPDYCSAVRWARDNRGAAEVVTQDSVDALVAAIDRLRNPAIRLERAREAIRWGKLYFAHDVAVSLLYRKLREAARHRRVFADERDDLHSDTFP